MIVLFWLYIAIGAVIAHLWMWQMRPSEVNMQTVVIMIPAVMLWPLVLVVLALRVVK